MQYSVLMSEIPLTYKMYRDLEDFGLKIPFDPKSPDINLYAYLPLEFNIPLSKVKTICNTLRDTGWKVTEYEVNIHINKVQEVNQPIIGDVVLYKEYKGLPFTVIDIQDSVAVISHPLRNIDLVLDIPIDNLCMLEEGISNSYTNENFRELDKALYIDCDSLDGKVSKLFFMMIRLKTMYKAYEIILLNPDTDMLSLARSLKISSIFGQVDYILLNSNSSDLIFSHNHYYLKYVDKLIVSKKNDYYSYLSELSLNDLGFKSKDSFLLFQAIKVLNKRKIIDKDLDFETLKNKINQSLEFVMVLFKPYEKSINLFLSEDNICYDLKVDKSDGEISFEEVQEVFTNFKLQYYLDNIEYYIYLLKS